MGSKKATAILGVPERLKALQEGSGLKSKAEFLRLCGIQKGQWARYLKGEQPRPAVFDRIAAATGRSAEWILTGVVDVDKLKIVSARAQAEPTTDDAGLDQAIEWLRVIFTDGEPWMRDAISGNLRMFAEGARNVRRPQISAKRKRSE